jgi:hypothetical protein
MTPGSPRTDDGTITSIVAPRRKGLEFPQGARADTKKGLGRRVALPKTALSFRGAALIVIVPITGKLERNLPIHRAWQSGG